MKKKLLIVLCVVLAVAAIVTASVVGTVAYMTSASKVSNVFTVGDVDILLDETKVNSQGEPELKNGEEQRTDGNSYHLLPGKSYRKDPAITVKPSTDASYIFLVTRNQISPIESTDADKPTMAQQMHANGWAIYKDTSVGSRVWIYCGKTNNDELSIIEGTPNVTGTFDPMDSQPYEYTPAVICGTNAATKADGMLAVPESVRIPIFEQFHVTNDKTISDTLGVYSGAEVTINAVGIQADTFKKDAEGSAIDKAWAAVVAQFPYIEDDIATND